MNLQSYPYASQRMPVIACNGIVATSQPLAAQAGLAMLQRGGNAVDAAVAAATALTVLEPTSNGIGGDAFALIWDGQQLHGLNASGRSPQMLSAEYVQDQGHEKVPLEGWLPVNVPGTPAAWGDLQARFGRLSLEEVMTPAIQYAEEGFGVTPIVAQFWAEGARRFAKVDDPVMAHWFDTFTKNGRAPSAGERWYSPDHAQTLRMIATQGAEVFYRGELAEKISDFAQETGGLLAMEDLDKHRNEWVDPIRTSYRGYDVWEIPPNGQGLAALIALAILEDTDVATHPQGSAESLHLGIEAMKLAFADGHRYIADQEHSDVPVTGLLDPDYISSRRALIGPKARVPEPGNPPQGGTVYLCTTDRDGMMVSYIQSNFAGFGSGVVVPQTGIALQNRGLGFSMEAGHPNEVAGGKRSYHTIIPGFLTRNDQPVGPFGVMGGSMQPQGHTQVMINMLDHDFNPQAALDAPRWRVQEGVKVDIELGTPEYVLRDLAARGHEVSVPVERGNFGRGQIISRLEEGVYVAGSDLRADGTAVGW